MSNPRNINMKSSKLSNFHYIHVRLHIITPPPMRVIVPEHKTSFAICSRLPLEGTLDG